METCSPPLPAEIWAKILGMHLWDATTMLRMRQVCTVWRDECARLPLTLQWSLCRKWPPAEIRSRVVSVRVDDDTSLTFSGNGMTQLRELITNNSAIVHVPEQVELVQSNWSELHIPLRSSLRELIFNRTTRKVGDGNECGIYHDKHEPSPIIPHPRALCINRADSCLERIIAPRTIIETNHPMRLREIVCISTRVDADRIVCYLAETNDPVAWISPDFYHAAVSITYEQLRHMIRAHYYCMGDLLVITEWNDSDIEPGLIDSAFIAPLERIDAPKAAPDTHSMHVSTKCGLYFNRILLDMTNAVPCARVIYNVLHQKKISGECLDVGWVRLDRSRVEYLEGL